MRDYGKIAKQYAATVASGKTPACQWVKYAARNFQKIYSDKKGPVYFDSARVEKVCNFIENLDHTKGRWAARGEKIKLEPWQVFFLANVFGVIERSTGMRRYRRAMLIVPRKNGKSLLAAAIGLYMLTNDDEFGSEVYSGATSEKQAWEVFRPAHLMAKKNIDLQSAFGLAVNASNVSVPGTNSKFEPLIGNPGDGASPHCAIIDEYHEHDSDSMMATMETGMGSREQPLALVITTAGDNTGGPCYQSMREAQQALQGVISMPDTFALIYTIDDDDDWTSEAALRKANPNYGVSVSAKFLLEKQREAMISARKQGTFKIKHLDVWVGARSAFFNLEAWKQCGRDINPSMYAGRPAWIGLDLASKIDLAAMNLLFELPGGRFAQFARYYLPEETINKPENDQYRAWVASGHITATPGAIIDFDFIRADIIDYFTDYGVLEVAFDPHQATMLITELMKEDIPCVQVRPTVLNFSEPMKTLEGLIASRKIEHDGNPVTEWMISNVVAFVDAKDNVYPRKEKPENKIDGVVALLMALARATQPREDSRSVYEDRGVVFA